MEPATYGIIIYQGATWKRELTLKQDNSPLHLSGYSAQMIIKSGNDVVLDLNSGSGDIVVGDSSPNITITITSTKTALLNFGSATYVLEIASGGVVDRLLEGSVTLHKR